MELNKRNFGLALGLVWGFGVMLGTWWLMWMGSPGDTISKLGGFYWGYSFSFGGSIIGFLWGFVDGFVLGFLIAWFYNMFGKKRIDSDEANEG